MARLSREGVKKLIMVAGYDAVAKKIGLESANLRQRANGWLKWTDEIEYDVLRALRDLGVLQEVSLITKRARRLLKEYGNKYGQFEKKGD